jgi:HisA/HisF family protein
MKIIPVLDVLDGQVVHAVAGRRSEYRRVMSRLTSSADPIEVAHAIKDSFGLENFYVADLDAILAQQPNYDLYRRLKAEGFAILLDAGIRNRQDLTSVLDAGVTRVVVGLESCSSPDDLADITARVPGVTFSLDLFQGNPRRCEGSKGWSDDPYEIIREAIQANVKTILPLDLSDVGMATGGSTDSICQFIRTEFPTISVIAGGGVRGPQDLDRLSRLGVDAVLIASALHDGRLVRQDLFDR